MATSERIERLKAAAAGDDGASGLGLALVAAAVAALVSLPLVVLFVRASNYGLGHLLGLFTYSGSVTTLVNSLVLVFWVTLGCVLVGVPLAVLTVQTDLPGRRFWTIVAALPLVVPSYIGAFTFVSAFGPRGDLADALAPLGIERIPAIYGLHGTALVLILFTYPYVFLTTRAALLSFDGTLVEAARTLNHSRWEAFKRVTVPRFSPASRRARCSPRCTHSRTSARHPSCATRCSPSRYTSPSRASASPRGSRRCSHYSCSASSPSCSPSNPASAVTARRTSRGAPASPDASNSAPGRCPRSRSVPR